MSVAGESSPLVLDDRDYAVWRDDICDRMLGVDCRRAGGFGMRLDLQPLGGPVLLDAVNVHRGVTLVRTAQRIARGVTEDAIGLSLVLEGASQVRGGGREVELRPGDLCLLDSREPFDKTLSDDYREQFMWLPRAFAEAHVGGRFSVVGPLVAPHEGLGQFLADSVELFSRSRTRLCPSELRPLLGSFAQMAAAVFCSGFSPEESGPSVRALARARAERYIEAHLDDPTISPGAIAAALGFSTRYLHLAFENGASVGATILARRLERCRERLRDLRFRSQSVSEIAFAFGFNDAAHFSRAFKARFGIAPREARR